VSNRDHEHTFYAHPDPRWLVCDCGQYAVRTRTSHGQPTVRLIDPPQPIFRHLAASDLCTPLTVTDVRATDVRATDVRETHLQSA
jgi:hypothetical protein